jgi:hypothetical protein
VFIFAALALFSATRSISLALTGSKIRWRNLKRIALLGPIRFWRNLRQIRNRKMALNNC